MKLSDHAVTVLKNFSQINKSIKISEGSIIKTAAPRLPIIAEANVPDSFPQDFCLADLGKFLGIVSMMAEPDIEYEDKCLWIHSGDQAVRIIYGDESMIVAAPKKPYVLPQVDIEFDVTQDQLSRIIKAIGILQLDTIQIVGRSNELSIRAMKSSQPGYDEFQITLGETDKDFDVMFLPERFAKIASGDYHCELMIDKAVKFVGPMFTYVIAAEDPSKKTRR